MKYIYGTLAAYFIFMMFVCGYGVIAQSRFIIGPVLGFFYLVFAMMFVELAKEAQANP